MKRKHIPGCYCCQNTDGPCPECCDPEEVLPQFSMPPFWVQRSRNVDTECCCIREVWDYTNTDPILQCCDKLGTYGYQQTGVRSDYTWKLWPEALDIALQCCPPECPSNCCIPDAPYKIAEWTRTWTDTLNYWFPVRFYLDSAFIVWGRELIECPEDETPQCRYFLKTVINGRFSASVVTERIINDKQELTYLDDCWVYDPSVNNNNPAMVCEYEDNFHYCPEQEACDLPLSQTCKDYLEIDNQPSSCWGQSNSFCIERIRYFDEPPQGQVNFTNDDIVIDDPQYCTHPACDMPCNNGFVVTEISVVSPTPQPPKWYTTPPTITQTTTTHIIDWNWCPDPSGGISSCCEGEGVVCTVNCEDNPCENPTVEIDVVCQSIVSRPSEWLETDPAQCELQGWYLNGTAESGTGRNDITGGVVADNSIGCFFVEDPNFLTGSPPCIAVKPITSQNPCLPSNCYATKICECFCGCIQTAYAYVWFSSNTLSMTVSGEWSTKECILPAPNVPITIIY